MITIQQVHFAISKILITPEYSLHNFSYTVYITHERRAKQSFDARSRKADKGYTNLIPMFFCRKLIIAPDFAGTNIFPALQK